ncbi:MAG: hypothetical protein ABIO55_00425, partial [Ginsengibacter sp.]
MNKFSKILKAAIAVFAAINIIRLVRRWVSVPNRLFFYSPIFRDKMLATGAVATLAPNFFSLEPSFTLFEDFSFVTSAATKKKKWLLFHKSDGSGCTAFVDRNYIFNVIKYYPPNALSDWPWEYVKVDGRGYLLLIGLPFHEDTGGKLHVGFAQVLDDGTYVEWWRTLLPMSYPDWIVGLPGAHAWYVKDKAPGVGGTLYIFDVKHAQILGSRRWEEQWDGMACEGNILFFYTSRNNSEMCILKDNYEIVTVRKRGLDPDLLLSLPFDYIASTGGIHFCWTFTLAYQPRIRVLSPAGFSEKAKAHLDDIWY